MTGPNVPRRDPFLAALRDATHSLHTDAEKSGFVRDLLQGNATREGYTLWLRNLQPAYEAMERGLDALPHSPGLAGLAMPAVYRTGALEHDLAALCGPAWRTSAPVLPEGDAYAQRIASVSGDPARLAAHAYVRYLGDLNGGQLVGRIVARSLGVGEASLSFYRFASETSVLEAAYRSALADAGRTMADLAPALEEAALAFRMNIALSEAVRDAVRAAT